MTHYMELYLILRERITKGAFRFGEKLPSKRQLAEREGLSLVTVTHAYELLTEEGYVEARERSGYFVCYREADSYGAARPWHIRPQIVEAAKPEPREEGERELFPFSAFAKTMRSVLTAYGEKLLDPSPYAGMAELRRAITSYLARSRHMDISPSQVIVGSGAEYLYGLNIQALGRHHLYGLERPSYDKIQKVYRANEVPLDFLTMGREGIESAELARTQATILHVTPYNSYPSGITASASKRAEYIRWAEERDGILIEDDFDSEFTLLSKPVDTLFSLSTQGRVIYMNTFSKTIAPSLRVGYLVLPKNLVPLYEEKTGFYSCTVPVFDQLVLAAFMDSGQFERHINRVRRARRKAAARLP